MESPLQNSKNGGVLYELTTESRIIETRRGLEALVFEIPLGILKIICIVNIPEEGLRVAPVYIKFKFGEAKEPPRSLTPRNRQRAVQPHPEVLNLRPPAHDPRE